MKNLKVIRSNAVSAVKDDGRLIADVAAEFGIPRRKLYQWLSAKPERSAANNQVDNVVGAETMALKAQLKILHTEVQLLKSQLSQYKIVESLEDGRIVLDFQKNITLDKHLKNVG